MIKVQIPEASTGYKTTREVKNVNCQSTRLKLKIILRKIFGCHAEKYHLPDSNAHGFFILFETDNVYLTSQ